MPLGARSIDEARTTIGRKIALAVGVPVLVAAMIGIGVSWLRAEQILRKGAADEASAQADLVAASFTLLDPAPAPAATGAMVHRKAEATLRADLPLLESAQVLRVIGREGVIRWSRQPGEQGQRVDDAARLLAAPAGGASDLAAGEHLRPLGGPACARCHGGDGERLGTVQAVVPRATAAGDVERLFRLLALSGLLLYVALLAASTLALRRLATLPLTRLTEMMQRAEQGDFLVRARVESRDEIGRLAAAFNSMLGKITEMKVTEIDTARELESVHRELELKAELEEKNALIEENNRALARRIRDVTLLLELSQSLNSSLEITETLQIITEKVGVSLGVDQLAVMLLDDRAEILQVAASFGFRSAGLAEFQLPVGMGASGLAAQTREPVYVRDVASDPRYIKGPQDPEGDASVLSVPMIWKEKLVGVMSFVRTGKAAFSDNDLVLLRLVGSQAALAIVNARLYTETRELSLTDELTGLFNRRSLFARLEMEVARAQRFGKPLSALMIDIDHFKQLNDTSGHPAGDQILKAVAALLQGSVRKVDTVARYGGEEFLLLLPLNGTAEAMEVGEKLRRAVEQTVFEHADRQPGGRLTISVGVACLPDDADGVERLVDAVDAALYASKRGGRNRVTAFTPGMDLHPGRQRGPLAENRQRRDSEPAKAD